MTRLHAAARLAVVLALFASTQGLLFAQGAFSVNRAWIAETLCVNRDVPELDCEGSCELTKRIEAQHDRDEQNRAAGLELALSVSAVATDALAVSADDEADARTPSRARDCPRDGRDEPNGVFHPPRIG